MGLPSACRAGPGVLDGPIQGVVCDLLPALAPDHAVVGASGELLVVGHGLDVPDGPSSFCRGDNLHPTPHADQGQGNRTTSARPPSGSKTTRPNRIPIMVARAMSLVMVPAPHLFLVQTHQEHRFSPIPFVTPRFPAIRFPHLMFLLAPSQVWFLYSRRGKGGDEE